MKLSIIQIINEQKLFLDTLKKYGGEERVKLNAIKKAWDNKEFKSEYKKREKLTNKDIYRGASLRQSTIKSLKENSIITFNYPQSFTLNKKVANYFSKRNWNMYSDFIATIYIIKGSKKVVDISKFMFYPEDKEVLFVGKLKIESIKKSNNRCLIVLKAI